MQTVHLRINDAATGQPTPCRLRITDANGAYRPPLGRLARFALAAGADVGANLFLDGKEFCYIDGTCEVVLPPGPIHIDAHKGPEFSSLHEEVNLPAGKLSLRFELKRHIDLRKDGWYSGDASAFYMSPHAALLEAAGEDLAVVNLLALADGDTIPNLLAFSGQKPALEMSGHMVVVNTLNVAGDVRLSLLNSHRVVYPLTFSGDDWSLDAWCDQCHRKAGLVVCHGFGSPIGKSDALELGDLSRPRLEAWYGALNAGLRLPIVGGSGKDSNAKLLGGVRTYAQLQPGEELTYKNWIEAIRAGRTFITNGPLLKFNVDPSPDSIHVNASVHTPTDHLEIIADGQVVAQSRTATIDQVIPSARWVAARCWSDSGLAAHTSAVFIKGTN